MPADQRRASSGNQNIKGYAFISPWLVGFTFFLLVPVIMSVYYSVCEYNPIEKSEKSGAVFIGSSNYSEMLHSDLFWSSLGITLKYAALAVPAGLLVSLALALLLNMRVPGQPIFRTIIFIPSLVPLVASAMLWLWMYDYKNGLFNTLLGKAHLSGPNWLVDWALPSLVFMSLWGVGNTVVIFLAGLQDVPRELYEAAEIDGASSLRRLWHVTIPMLSPVIFFNLIMSIIGTFQVFAVPYSMTQGGPDNATYFFTYLIYDSAFSNNRMGYASALGLVQLVIILILTGIAAWSSRRWVHYQGK